MVVNLTDITLSEFLNVKMDLANNSSGTTMWPDGRQSEGAEKSGDGQRVVIAAAVVISLAVMVICSLLCYREMGRRRVEAFLLEEYLRKEEIKRTIKRKIAQMQDVDDSDSYLEGMKLKVPLVTFGDVTKISPAHSSEMLHHHHLHFFHHHHHHHHHHAHHKQSTVDKDIRDIPVCHFGGNEKHWRLTSHRVPTRGRFLSSLFGSGRGKDKKKAKHCQTSDVELALVPKPKVSQTPTSKPQASQTPTSKQQGSKHLTSSEQAPHPPSPSQQGSKHLTPREQAPHPPSPSQQGSKHLTSSEQASHPPSPSQQGSKHLTSSEKAPHPPSSSQQGSLHLTSKQTDQLSS